MFGRRRHCDNCGREQRATAPTEPDDIFWTVRQPTRMVCSDCFTAITGEVRGGIGRELRRIDDSRARPQTQTRARTH